MNDLYIIHIIGNEIVHYQQAIFNDQKNFKKICIYLYI